MSLNPIGIVLTALGLITAAYFTWQDAINGFAAGRVEQVRRRDRVAYRISRDAVACRQGWH